MRRLRKFFVPVLIIPTLACMLSCESRPKEVLEPLPSMTYERIEPVSFHTQQEWQGKSVDWESVIKALHFEMYMPDTLEIKLHKSERDYWKNALNSIEKYRIRNHDAKILSNLQFIPLEECQAPSEAFSIHQRAMLQQLLQHHRNILWRLGRLELANHYWLSSIQSLAEAFKNDRIKDADSLVYVPISKIIEQSTEFTGKHQILTGKWRPGSIHLRIARLKTNLDILIEARYTLQSWQEKTAASKRWNYLAPLANQPIEAANQWIEEYQSIFEAFKSYAEQSLRVEQAFAPPHALEAYPCFSQNMRRLRILASLYNLLLPMQWELSWARYYAKIVDHAVLGDNYADTQTEYIRSELKQFITGVEQQKNLLTQSEDLLLIVWDESNREFWNNLPDFINSIEYHSQPACENAEVWRTIYHEIQQDIDFSTDKVEPEPPQPLGKRGKPGTPLVSDVLDLVRSPTRIDEVEKGLLAIYELEAHMSAIRDELLRLCKRGACKGFPEAQLPKSPRNSSWVNLWHQTPANERTLGLSTIVLKLCQLHLSRLVQRLSEIYAWFAETSNADINWPKLKSWQRIWTLYAEQNGTYLSFLRSIAELDQTVHDIAKPNAKKTRSEKMESLLTFQSQLFGITIDYARFIDGSQPSPVPFDELLETWAKLYDLLAAMEKATLERDAQSNGTTPK